MSLSRVKGNVVFYKEKLILDVSKFVALKKKANKIIVNFNNSKKIVFCETVNKLFTL